MPLAERVHCVCGEPRRQQQPKRGASRYYTNSTHTDRSLHNIIMKLTFSLCTPLKYTSKHQFQILSSRTIPLPPLSFSNRVNIQLVKDGHSSVYFFIKRKNDRPLLLSQRAQFECIFATASCRNLDENRPLLAKLLYIY